MNLEFTTYEIVVLYLRTLTDCKISQARPSFKLDLMYGRFMTETGKAGVESAGI
jgi:hypothetical protein